MPSRMNAAMSVLETFRGSTRCTPFASSWDAHQRSFPDLNERGVNWISVWFTVIETVAVAAGGIGGGIGLFLSSIPTLQVS
jgi:hypothetical protein